MSKYIIIIVVVLLLAGCNNMSPETKEFIVKMVQERVESGELTREQGLALAKGLTGAGWDNLSNLALSTLSGVILSLTGVRVWRGGIGARRGNTG